jgi:hypothetical protein
MAIPLIGEQGLFTRLGYIGRILNRVTSLQSGALVDDVQLLAGQFITDRILTDTLQTQLASEQAGMLSFPNYLKTVAQSIVTTMVNEDSPQPDTGLQTALIELIAQMQQYGWGVAPSNTGYTITPSDRNNAIDAVVVVSLKDKTGLELQNIFQEQLVLTVSTDAQEGGAVSGSELLQGEGEYAASNVFDFTWPVGSNSTFNLQAVNASIFGAGNLLTNSSFDKFTTGHANNWVYEVGAAQIHANTLGSDPACVSTGSIEFVGDGSTLTSLSQTFGDRTNGTAGTLNPWRQYAINLWVGPLSTPTAGVLEVALCNATTGDLTYDDQGEPNAFHIPLVGMTPVCVPVNGVFRTPRALELPVKLRICLVSPLNTGCSLVIDHVAFTELKEAYTYGPSLAVFSGSFNLIRQDSFSVGIQNDRAGQWNTLFHRLFNIPRYRLQLPLAGSDITDGTDGMGITEIDQSVLDVSDSLSGCSLATLSLDGLESLLAF